MKEQREKQGGLVELAKCAKLLTDVRADTSGAGGVHGRGIEVVDEAMEGLEQAGDWI